MRSVKTLCIVISLYNIINTSYKSVRCSMPRCIFLSVREHTVRWQDAHLRCSVDNNAVLLQGVPKKKFLR